MNSDASHVVQLLREHGLRPTMARRQIMSLLMGHRNHPSTEEIIAALRKKGRKASAATIYQNLARLVEASLLTRFSGAGGVLRYDADLTPHHHLICTMCGRVADVNPDARQSPDPKAVNQSAGAYPEGWKIEGLQLEFKGLCPECLKKA
jgi:Fur family peroxide stress response transcriptional regulator